MDIDYKERPQKLMQEEQDRYFKEGHCLRCWQKGHMAISCPTFLTSLPIPAHSPACPPAKKVAVVETIASVEEVAVEDEEWIIGQLSSPKENYN